MASTINLNASIEGLAKAVAAQLGTNEIVHVINSLPAGATGVSIPVTSLAEITGLLVIGARGVTFTKGATLGDNGCDPYYVELSVNDPVAAPTLAFDNAGTQAATVEIYAFGQ